MRLRLIIVPSFLVLLTAAFATPALATSIYDGEELFDGLFFGDGIVGKLFPEVWDIGQPPAAPPFTQIEYANLLNSEANRLDAENRPVLAQVARDLASQLLDNPGLDPTPRVHGGPLFRSLVKATIDSVDVGFYRALEDSLRLGHQFDVESVISRGSRRLLDAAAIVVANPPGGQVDWEAVDYYVWLVVANEVGIGSYVVIILAIVGEDGVSALSLDDWINQVTDRLYLATPVLEDHFDSYQPGDVVAQSAWGFFNQQGSPQSDAQVVNALARTGPYSLRTKPLTDIVLPGLGLTAGEWSTWMRLRVPSSSSGQHNISLLSSYTGQGTPSVAAEVQVDMTNGRIVHPASASELVLTPDDWGLLEVYVDLDAGTHTIRYDNDVLYEGALTAKAMSSTTTYEALRIQTNGASPLYIEDLVVAPVGATATAAPGDIVNGPIPASLLKVHPNPSNPRTEISFFMPRGGDVSLQIFDLRGRKVRDLVAGNFPAGAHEATWDGRADDGSNVASGSYLVRMVAPDITSSTRVSLVR